MIPKKRRPIQKYYSDRWVPDMLLPWPDRAPGRANLEFLVALAVAEFGVRHKRLIWDG